MAAQQQKRNKLAEEQEEIEEMQHGPFTIEQRQETYKRENNQLPPPWAIMAILIPGFIEFWIILSTPSYHWAIFVAFLLGTTFYVQHDISGIFRNGAVSYLDN
ncbi:hypothetical protein KFK09_024237 [Dendrobium nobile]|uniref:Sey1/RHD3-like three-helix bundle domain-containing protein n=1 Tax=Dendrobium nobile TaxID=94219 RepID=A0A8T3AC39_DENNO|nr:hypothetical protein KFK09_024237 [Dendrobium nobile]